MPQQVEGQGLLLQQKHPVAPLMSICWIKRMIEATMPNAIDGLIGYIQVPSSVYSTWSACNIHVHNIVI